MCVRAQEREREKVYVCAIIFSYLLPVTSVLSLSFVLHPHRYPFFCSFMHNTLI